MPIVLIVVFCLIFFSGLAYLECWDKIEAQEKQDRYDAIMKRYKL